MSNINELCLIWLEYAINESCLIWMSCVYTFIDMIEISLAWRSNDVSIHLFDILVTLNSVRGVFRWNMTWMAFDTDRKIAWMLFNDTIEKHHATHSYELNDSDLCRWIAFKRSFNPHHRNDLRVMLNYIQMIFLSTLQWCFSPLAWHSSDASIPITEMTFEWCFNSTSFACHSMRVVQVMFNWNITCLIETSLDVSIQHHVHAIQSDVSIKQMLRKFAFAFWLPTHTICFLTSYALPLHAIQSDPSQFQIRFHGSRQESLSLLRSWCLSIKHDLNDIWLTFQRISRIWQPLQIT